MAATSGCQYPHCDHAETLSVCSRCTKKFCPEHINVPTEPILCRECVSKNHDQDVTEEGPPKRKQCNTCKKDVCVDHFSARDPSVCLQCCDTGPALPYPWPAHHKKKTCEWDGCKVVVRSTAACRGCSKYFCLCHTNDSSRDCLKCHPDTADRADGYDKCHECWIPLIGTVLQCVACGEQTCKRCLDNCDTCLTCADPTSEEVKSAAVKSQTDEGTPVARLDPNGRRCGGGCHSNLIYRAEDLKACQVEGCERPGLQCPACLAAETVDGKLACIACIVRRLRPEQRKKKRKAKALFAARKSKRAKTAK